MGTSFTVYLLVLAAASYLIRVTPFLLLKEPIRNEFIQSFLYYVPYVTLAVMTFPAILSATQYPLAGALALVAGILAARHGKGLFAVTFSCCVTALLTEVIITHLL
ncbi:MAG: AzlD domain-containing protein [Mogibacterium sp.]|nr:AzlD domain-containing protein [Mogibacterium sp.]